MDKSRILLKHKQFFTYDKQISHLKSKSLIIADEISAQQTLSKTGYYALINGYKDIFKNPNTNTYLPTTTFDDIYHLYQFDADLRQIFLKPILTVETHIKSSLSYHFTQLYGNGKAYYQNIHYYDGNEKELLHLFQKMNSKMSGKYISPQVKHYLDTYHDVPLWVLNTTLTLGEIATMFRYLKGHCKKLICMDFNHIFHPDLSKMLIILTKYRNICAHGNRLFNYQTQDQLRDNIIHSKLKIEKQGTLYLNGKSDLFAVVIILKFLLSPEDFRVFYYELKRTIKKYEIPAYTLTLMGFPQNWMSILRIKI